MAGASLAFSSPRLQLRGLSKCSPGTQDIFLCQRSQLRVSPVPVLRFRSQDCLHKIKGLRSSATRRCVRRLPLAIPSDDLVSLTSEAERSDKSPNEVGYNSVGPCAAVSQQDNSLNENLGVLRDTTDELKKQQEKATALLEETVAAAAPHSTSKQSYAKLHDFCLGIPYGTSLVIGGLVWFLISGSTAAVRFGVVLGGILLALSVSSLSAWKKGKSSNWYIKGQAAIALAIAVRELRRVFEVKAFSPSVITALASAGMVGFFCYVQLAGGNPPPKKTRQVTPAE